MLETHASRRRFASWVKRISLGVGIGLAPVMTFGFHTIKSQADGLGVITAILWLGTGIGLIYCVVYFFMEALPNWVSAGTHRAPKTRAQRKLDRQMAIEAARAKATEEARLAFIKANLDPNGEPKVIEQVMNAVEGHYNPYVPGGDNVTPITDASKPRKRFLPTNPSRWDHSGFTYH